MGINKGEPGGVSLHVCTLCCFVAARRFSVRIFEFKLVFVKEALSEFELEFEFGVGFELGPSGEKVTPKWVR